MRRAKWILVVAALILAASPAALAQKAYSVTARVDSGTGAIRAKLVPGDFTVPAGKTAVIVSFYHSCPKSNYENKKLGKNIYSLTAKRQMVDANDKPLTSLPPGKYRFSVGGRPGASGKLVYRLVP
jgi:hypothetical protein